MHRPRQLDTWADQHAPPAIMPTFPTNVLEWIKAARPTIGRIVRDFDLTPFLTELYEDNTPNIMVVAGRQTYKTTFCTDILGCYATTRPRSELCYVTDNEAHLSAFSKQRLRIETFLQNSELRKFLRHERANIGEFSLWNDTAIYLVTDEGEYKKVEGKSLQVLMLDEAQYQDIQFIQKAMYSLFQTHGRIYVLGIGGEAGSPYEKFWRRTDQREWVYDDPYWRDKLEFNAKGDIVNQNLKQVLAGRWVAQKPENTQFRGYHLPQPIYASIPLTIGDAVQRYNTNPEFSIEYQRKYSPASIYTSHVVGEFYKASRRPITPEMVEACYDNSLGFLKSPEVLQLKEIFGNDIRVLGGVDFGSSITIPTTVASVTIKWKKSNRTQIAYMEKIPQTDHPYDKAKRIVDIFASYGVDKAVGDIGHAQDMIPIIQNGGRDSKDRKFIGLGKKRFESCRTIGDETKPQLDYKTEVDEHGKQLSRTQIDKTTTIQAFVDFVGAYVAHPTRPEEDELRKTQLIIPHKFDYETDFLLDDLCSLTRKDLEEVPDVTIVDPRQRVRKEFNHPSDSMMSLIYCQVADQTYDEDAYRIHKVQR